MKYAMNNEGLWVSFVLPAYKATYLKQAIDSILFQSYSNFEIIIVNDASPENLDEIVCTYTDERIRYYVNAENIGGKSLVAQWNHCISYAKGDYIVLAADDDLYHPHFLKNCMELALKYPEVDLIRSRVEQIDTDNKTIGVDGLLPEFTNKYEYFYYWMIAASFVCIGNFVFKASALRTKGFIDFPCAYGSDSASTIMMSRNGVANTKEMLFSFRISTIHLSSSNEHYKEKLKANSMLFSFLYQLNYSQSEDKFDCYYLKFLSYSRLYAKCRYDYYNLVIKKLPFYKFYYIKYCELLSFKDKCVMLLRFCFDKLLRK